MIGLALLRPSSTVLQKSPALRTRYQRVLSLPFEERSTGQGGGQPLNTEEIHARSY